MKHQTIEEVQNRISYLENVYTDARNATLLKKPLDDETEYYCLKPTEAAYKILGRAYIRNEIHNLKEKDLSVGACAIFFDKSKLFDKMYLDYAFISKEQYKRKLIDAINLYPELYNDEDIELKEKYLDLINKDINSFILEEKVCFELIKLENEELREELIKKLDKYFKDEAENSKKRKKLLF